MNSDHINRWLTLGANLGVLIGIFLLLVELEQNRDMMRAQIRNEVTQRSIEVMSLTASSRDLSGIITRASQGEEPTATERMMLATRNLALFRSWENAHYQYRQGLYDEEEFSTQLATWRDLFTSLEADSHMIDFWCTDRTHFSVHFRDEIDELLPDQACE